MCCFDQSDLIFSIESSATTQAGRSDDQVAFALLIAHVRPFYLVMPTPSSTGSSRCLRASSLVGVYLGISVVLTYPAASGGTFLIRSLAIAASSLSFHFVDVCQTRVSEAEVHTLVELW